MQTKLYIPPLRPDLVYRPRLIERLNEGLEHGRKLTLISAPAGFGKTTLVSAWLREINQAGVPQKQPMGHLGWLSLDKGDNDTTRFLVHLVAALRPAGSSRAPYDTMMKGLVGALQSPQPPPAEVVVTNLINNLTESTGRIVLVLDDYHLVEAQSIQDALTFLLQHLPAQMHLVILSREDPDLPLARLRAQNLLCELRAADLRFTLSETADFLNTAMALALSPTEIADLENRTEGWIAGLQMAAIALQGALAQQRLDRPAPSSGTRVGDTTKLIKAFSGNHRFVLDYLIEEVLEQQPREIQTFLLKTSILSRMTGDLCDALTGQKNGQTTLETLERANLFVVPLDDVRCWYRYHHLFADLLQQQLRQKKHDSVLDLHCLASDWYEQNGNAGDAIDHALFCQDYERSAALIERYVDHILHFGEPDRLRRWLATFPDEFTLSWPYLCILNAGTLFISGKPGEAERYLAAAEAILAGDATGVGQGAPQGAIRSNNLDLFTLKGRAAAVRSFIIAFDGDLEGSIYFAKQALEHLPPDDAAWRCSALDNLGSAYNSIGDIASAYDARLAVLEESKATGNGYMMLFGALRLVVTLRDMGRLEEAIDMCRQQLELAEEQGLLQTALVGWLHALWGELLAERNELEQAYTLAGKGVRLAEAGKDQVLLGSSYLCLMRVLFSRGDLAEAADLIQEMSSSLLRQELSPWITNQMDAWLARIRLVQGRLDDADRWAEGCYFDLDGELLPVHDFDYGVLARVLIAQEELLDASRLLKRLLEAAEAGRRTSKIIEINILSALAFYHAGKTDYALSAMQDALALAKPGGYICTFTDEGHTVAELLGKIRTQDQDMKAYISRLLKAFGHRVETPVPALIDQPLIEPLSERELEVLQGIAQGLTNQEIANRLYLSLNTVKVHNRNIFGKLGVNNRIQAVARSQELGLLPNFSP